MSVFKPHHWSLCRCTVCGAARGIHEGVHNRATCWTLTMKTLRNYALAMLAIVAFCIWTDPATAQTREVRELTADQGWHGVGGGVQVHQGSLEFRAPLVSVWERSARSGPEATRSGYGAWNYVQVVFNCENWSQVPVATIGDDWRVVLMVELTGQVPAWRWPDEGSTPYKTATALCGLYGFERRPLNAPRATAGEDGVPFVGGIKKTAERQVDKPSR